MRKWVGSEELENDVGRLGVELTRVVDGKGNCRAEEGSEGRNNMGRKRKGTNNSNQRGHEL